MYRENLPTSTVAQCPPIEATEPFGIEVCRFVSVIPPTITDFDSHLKLGKTPPAGLTDLCRFASCSVFKINKNGPNLNKLPKIKNKKFLVKLTLNNDSGKVLEGKNNHFDWWMYKSYDPTLSCVQVT